MRILYLGNDHPLMTSAQRANALRRLDHDVTHINPEGVVPRWRYVMSVNVRTGFRLFAAKVRRALFRGIGDRAFDAVWVDCGAALGPAVYREFCRRKWKIINYNIDDPFGGRDFRKWDLYKHAVRYHDLTVVMRDVNIAEAEFFGAKHVKRVYRSFDPVAHAPLALTGEEKQSWASEVVFVGSWMPERGPFIVKLLELGVPLTVWGDRWQKAREWPLLRRAVRGNAVYGADYVRAIQCAQIALGLLSRGNRDLHTTRSAEVPYIGGAAFCAERTSEHAWMYREGSEAMFWSSPEECAAVCLRMLADQTSRRQMVDAARRKVVAMGLSNDEVCAAILRELDM